MAYLNQRPSTISLLLTEPLLIYPHPSPRLSSAKTLCHIVYRKAPLFLGKGEVIKARYYLTRLSFCLPLLLLGH